MSKATQYTLYGGRNDWLCRLICTYLMHYDLRTLCVCALIAVGQEFLWLFTHTNTHSHRRIQTVCQFKKGASLWNTRYRIKIYENIRRVCVCLYRGLSCVCILIELIDLFHWQWKHDAPNLFDFDSPVYFWVSYIQPSHSFKLSFF